jgi:hypothetical protein
MTRDQLVDLCELRFRDPNNDIVTAALWASYIEMAETDIYIESPWFPMDENEATNTVLVADEGVIALPTDCYRVNSVYNDSDDYPIPPLSGRENSLVSLEDEGPPAYYQLRNRQLVLFPKNSSDVDVRITYMAKPAVMVNGSAEPNLPEAYHRLLVSGALAYAYEDDGQYAEADRHRSKFMVGIERLKDDMLVTRNEGYAEIIDTWGDY